jgi:hypothetical protein
VTEIIVFSAVFLSLIVVVLWLAFTRLAPRRAAKEDAGLPIDLLLPTGYLRNSSKIEMLLNELYEERREVSMSNKHRHRLTHARRLILQELLIGLKEDFSRLDRLMCSVASLSPEVERKEEIERLWLWIQFRLHYGLARLSLRVGLFSRADLSFICKTFEQLVARTQETLETLERRSLNPLRSRIEM